MDSGGAQSDAVQTAWTYIKDLAGPIAGVIGGAVVGVLAYLTTRGDTTTRRFHALFESQHEHIAMLQHEIGLLRVEVQGLRAALRDRLTICASCDRLPTAQKNLWDALTSLEPDKGGGND